MTDERHFHPCDCDDCINLGGGMVLPDAGRIKQVRVSRARVRLEKRRRNMKKAIKATRARYRAARDAA